jgi:hypothetical protein
MAQPVEREVLDLRRLAGSSERLVVTVALAGGAREDAGVSTLSSRAWRALSGGQRFAADPCGARLRVLGDLQVHAPCLEIEVAPFEVPQLARAGGGRECEDHERMQLRIGRRRRERSAARRVGKLAARDGKPLIRT